MSNIENVNIRANSNSKNNRILTMHIILKAKLLFEDL